MRTSVTGVVLCRLAAVLLFFQAVENAGFLLFQPSIATLSIGGLFAVGGLSVISPAVAAVLIWWFAERICRVGGVNRDPDPAAEDGSADESRLIATGTLLIGLYALLFGVITASRMEIGYLVQDTLGQGGGFSPSDESLLRLGNRLSYLFQILAGIVLVVGRDALAGFFVNFRRGGK